MDMVNAVRERNFARIRELGEEDPYNLTRFYNGSTPFDMATAWGYEDVIDLLLELGVRFEKECDNFFSPMETAIQYGYCALVEKFFNLGSNEIGREKEGHVFTLLNHAAGPGGNGECVRLLHRLGLVDETRYPSRTRDGSNPLHRAAFLGKIDTIQALLELFPSFLYEKSATGMFPIHASAVSREVDVARLMLAADADVLDYPDNNRNAPIHYAAQIDARAFVIFFHTQGSDVYHIVPEKEELDMEERDPAKRCALYRTLMFIRSLSEVLLLCD